MGREGGGGGGGGYATRRWRRVHIYPAGAHLGIASWRVGHGGKSEQPAAHRQHRFAIGWARRVSDRRQPPFLAGTGRSHRSACPSIAACMGHGCPFPTLTRIVKPVTTLVCRRSGVRFLCRTSAHGLCTTSTACWAGVRRRTRCQFQASITAGREGVYGYNTLCDYPLGRGVPKTELNFGLFLISGQRSSARCGTSNSPWLTVGCIGGT